MIIFISKQKYEKMHLIHENYYKGFAKLTSVDLQSIYPSFILSRQEKTSIDWPILFFTWGDNEASNLKVLSSKNKIKKLEYNRLLELRMIAT